MKSPSAAKNMMKAKMETKIRIESLKSSKMSIRLVRIELKNNITIIGLNELLMYAVSSLTAAWMRSTMQSIERIVNTQLWILRLLEGLSVQDAFKNR